MALDPVTASMEAITAVMNFLSTPIGQDIAAKLVALDEKLVAKIHEMIDQLSIANQKSDHP